MLVQDATTPLRDRLRASTVITLAQTNCAPELKRNATPIRETGGKPKKARAKPKRQPKPALSESICYSVDEARGRARCGRSTIYRAIAAGELKARKNGSRTFIMDEDLQAWVRAMPVLVPGRKAA